MTPLRLQAAAQERTPLRLQVVALPTHQAAVLPVAVAPTGRLWAGVWRAPDGTVSVQQRVEDTLRPRWRVLEALPEVPPLDLEGRRIAVGWGGLSTEAAAEALALAAWWELPLRMRYLGGSTPGSWRTVYVTRLEGATVRAQCPGRGQRRFRLDQVSGVGDLALAWSGTEYVPPEAIAGRAV